MLQMKPEAENKKWRPKAQKHITFASVGIDSVEMPRPENVGRAVGTLSVSCARAHDT